MPTNFRQFNREVTRFARTLPEELLVPFHKKLVLELLSRVVPKTPVKEGVARGGWQVGVGTSPTGQSDRTDKGGNETINAGAAALRNLPPFSIVYVANNVVYIIPLEKGSSQQASQGMLALSIDELLVIFPR